jgi:hypothetical protein
MFCRALIDFTVVLVVVRLGLADRAGHRIM